MEEITKEKRIERFKNHFLKMIHDYEQIKFLRKIMKNIGETPVERWDFALSFQDFDQHDKEALAELFDEEARSVLSMVK